MTNPTVENPVRFTLSKNDAMNTIIYDENDEALYHIVTKNTLFKKSPTFIYRENEKGTKVKIAELEFHLLKQDTIVLDGEQLPLAVTLPNKNRVSLSRDMPTPLGLLHWKLSKVLGRPQLFDEKGQCLLNYEYNMASRKPAGFDLDERLLPHMDLVVIGLTAVGYDLEAVTIAAAAGAAS